jgi:hypothetical protein
MRPADFPLRAFAVRRQNERALLGADEYSNFAHRFTCFDLWFLSVLTLRRTNDVVQDNFSNNDHGVSARLAQAHSALNPLLIGSTWASCRNWRQGCRQNPQAGCLRYITPYWSF